MISGDGSPATIAGVPIVNKKYGVSPDYAPGEDPTAAAAARKLIAAMQSQGLDVSDSWSGFRSYEYQSELYNGYVASSGQEAADTFSARPGFSEHQTGLAFDLKHASGALLENPAEAQWLLDHAHEYGFIVRYQEGWEISEHQTGLAFDLKHASGALLENPAEAQWLLDHAHEYGFIVRYQEGWESITGYMAEPWHIRYVGDIAEDIHARNIPLETYLGAEGFIVRYQEGWESITGYMAEPWHIRYVGDIAEDIHARNIPLETYLGAESGDYR